jgi:biotin carboxylase
VQPENRLIVVGTTPDYIDWIRRTCPERALFITDPIVRSQAKEPAPAPHEEVRCELSDSEQVRRALVRHLKRWDMGVNGVACFDCESMALAALLALDFSVDFPSPSAVNNCRDKLISKRLWQQNGIISPRIAPVRQAEDATAFFSTLGRDCVLKPLSGSGSELVFLCRTEQECRQAYTVIQAGLEQRKNHRLYSRVSEDSPRIIAEEFVDAPEFSCDFLMDDDKATLIRMAHKIPSSDGPFGTTMGYELVDTLPQGIELGKFCRYLAQGAGALGIDRSICMVDFMVHNGEIVLLEIAPRPGGDCLPALIRNALQLDILALTLDVAQKRPLRIGPFQPPQHTVGLRIHARQGGIFRHIDWAAIEGNPRIKEINVLRRAGDIIRMPPEDYDSFLLGNIIFIPENGMDLKDECRRLLDSLAVEIE